MSERSIPDRKILRYHCGIDDCNWKKSGKKQYWEALKAYREHILHEHIDFDFEVASAGLGTRVGLLRTYSTGHYEQPAQENPYDIIGHLWEELIPLPSEHKKRRR